VFQKAIPDQFNPFISLVITYVTAIITSLILYIIYPTNTTLLSNLKLSIWPSVLLGLVVVGLEVGFLLVYRSGWDLSVASMLSNITVALVLLPIGLLIYRETFTKINVLGVVLCILGLILVKR
jgi:uncharacterized membrane protein